ncbi:hypothetical protein PO124_11575 [Bacillus licheniformis]|nr:hypothetical protein [Bacillus licheniformis]
MRSERVLCGGAEKRNEFERLKERAADVARSNTSSSAPQTMRQRHRRLVKAADSPQFKRAMRCPVHLANLRAS